MSVQTQINTAVSRIRHGGAADSGTATIPVTNGVELHEAEYIAEEVASATGMSVRSVSRYTITLY